MVHPQTGRKKRARNQQKLAKLFRLWLKDMRCCPTGFKMVAGKTAAQHLEGIERELLKRPLPDGRDWYAINRSKVQRFRTALSGLHWLIEKATRRHNHGYFVMWTIHNPAERQRRFRARVKTNIRLVRKALKARGFI